MKIEFDLDEFTTWLDDLIEVEYQQCGPRTITMNCTITDEDGTLYWCLKWDNIGEHKQKRMEVALVGRIKDM